MNVDESRIRMGADVEASLAATICFFLKKADVVGEKGQCLGIARRVHSLILTFCRKDSVEDALTSSRYWREITMSPFVFIKYSMLIIVDERGSK